jgi:RNA polymerase sigma factor (sigma-70 family)
LHICKTITTFAKVKETKEYNNNLNKRRHKIMNVKNVTNYIVRTELTTAFLKDLKKYPIMTKQDEVELFGKYEDSVARTNEIRSAENFPNREAAIAREERMQNEIRNEIIMRNQRFNFAVAKRYDNNEILMDLVNVGTIGMYEAFEKFNYKEGIRFCSFAVWYIRRAINAYLVKENMTVRTTNNTRYAPKVRKIENDFMLQNGRKPSGSEVVDILFDEYGLEVAAESDIYGVRMEYIDASYGEDEDFTYEKCSEFATATATSNGYENVIENESISKGTRVALSNLSERERIIICMSTGYGYDKEYKDKEIAEVIGLTSERVRQLRHAATKKFAAAYNAVAK